VARWIDQAVYVVTRDGAGRSLHRVNLLDGTYTNVSRAWTLAGTMTGADVSADGRRVVYALSSGGQEDLWVANIDGTSPARLTTDQFFEHHPLWSGRGTSVIYQSNRGGQIDLWEVGVESRRSRSLTSSPVTEEPESTSADGRLVSFRQVSETSHLFTWNAANATQLTDDALGDFSPTTARDGAVVFQRSRPSALLGNPLSDSSLLLGVLEGSRFRSAPTALAEGFAARLSPDGARLAYLQRGADPQRATLVVRDLRSGTTVEVSSTCPRPSYSLSSLEWVDHNLTWNASGTDLFFVDRPDGYVVRRHRVGAGVAEPPLATAGVREVIQDVHLSADGRVLAYIVAGVKGATVHLVDAESGAERSATRLEGPVSARGWRSGDASLIVLRRTRLFDDATAELDVLEVSTTGSVRPIGRLDHALLQTVRLDRSRSAMYVVRSEAGVHNLYEYALASRALRRVSDNARPGVTFSGVEPLREGAILGVRLERRSDVYLLDAAPPVLDAPNPPRR
jgi:Tol biopolymer transport system component